MSSKYIRKSEPGHPPKVKKVQIITELVRATILGPYGSELKEHARLPKVIERKDREKEATFIKRCNKVLEKHPGASIQWKETRTGIQHRDYRVNNGG